MVCRLPFCVLCCATRFMLVCSATLAEEGVLQQGVPRLHATPRPSAELLLSHMPTNSGQRCVGISAAIEAILDGKPMENQSPPSPEELAKAIFESLTTGKQVHFPNTLEIAGRTVSVGDKVSLEYLGTRVTIFYKREVDRLMRSPRGVARLEKAERLAVKNLDELDALLADDADHLKFFCCFGTRRFDDGRMRTTKHAVLIRRLPDGSRAIYDSNAPGKPIVPKFAELAEGLTIEWTCPYRDTGEITTQRYRVVEKQRYFRAIRAEQLE